MPYVYSVSLAEATNKANVVESLTQASLVPPEVRRASASFFSKAIYSAWQPGHKRGAICLDHLVELPGIGLLEQAKMDAVADRQLALHAGNRTLRDCG